VAARLPILVSLPHAGLEVPPEVAGLLAIGPEELRQDSDEGAAEIYTPLAELAVELVSTPIARAIVDVNRAATDRRPIGAIKGHTFWKKPVFRAPLPDALRALLLAAYHAPYHARLASLAPRAALGLDCHTMAAEAPPVGPRPGQRRPRACLGNGGVTLPGNWLRLMAEALGRHLGTRVALNRPFPGGHITRSRPGGIPWVQLELSREPWLSLEQKAAAVRAALLEVAPRLTAGAPRPPPPRTG